MRIQNIIACATAAAALLTATSAVAVAAESDPAAKQAKLTKKVAEAVELFKTTDPKMKTLFNDAAGYAVLPGVAKGGAGIGAAHGEGLVFEKGKVIGRTKMTQVTIGLQLGGQSYDEVIFFETKDALDDFKKGKSAVSAQASGVAAAEGASANARYQHGVLIYTIAKNGLMGEASVGGQKFTFYPLEK